MNFYPGAPEGCLPLPPLIADPPVPADVRKLLVLGGSFDPVHVGHRLLAAGVRDALGLDWLLVIPAGQSPHKDEAPLFSAEERLELLKMAFRGDGRVSLCRIEIDRRERYPDTPSYTVDTLHTLRGFLPLGVEMFLLMGEDQALQLHRWREPLAVMALAEPVVMRRAGSAEEAIELAERIGRNWPSDAPGVGAADWAKRIVDVARVDVSSTEVRALLAAAPSEEREARLRELLDPAVYERMRALRCGR